MHRVFFIALLFTAPAFADTKPSARLCITGQPCVDADPGALDPAERPRTFAWIDSARATAVLGVVGAGATRISTDAAVGTFELRVTSRAADRWPAAASFELRDGNDQTWRLDLGRTDVQKAWRIRVKPGKYVLTLDAPRHRRSAQEIEIVAHAPSTVKIALEPLPAIEGRVISRSDRSPLPGAAVSLEPPNVIAISDGTGHFAFDADPDRWPSTIHVSAAGYGSAVIPIPRARRQTVLGDVELSAGASILVAVDRSDEIGDVKLDLRKSREATPFASPTATAEASVSQFTDVEAGDYILMASGDEPGEKFGVKVTVAESEEKRIDLHLVPRLMKIHVEMGDEPLSSARLDLRNIDGAWKESVQTDLGGNAKITVWQSGRFSAFVWSEERLTTPHTASGSFADTGDIEWTIRVPSREVVGTVVDASTKRPIPNANVAIQTASRGTGTGKTDDRGRFRFTAIPPGQVTLMAAAEGYLHDKMKIVVSSAEQVNEVTLPIFKAAAARIVVRDAAGRPIPGAAVLDYAGLTLTGDRATDANGRLEIPLGKDETRDVFVIPRDGSFSFASIRPSAEEKAIVVPEPLATIVLNTESTDHERVPNVWVVVRYNGVVLPFEVQQAAARMQGSQPVSGSDGRIIFRHVPSGVYEFWPVNSAQEVQAMTLGLGPDAPVRIVARPGLNSAVLTFSPAKP